MNKKIISALLCICLVLTIALCAVACDKDEVTESPSTEPTETPTSKPTENAPTEPTPTEPGPTEPEISHTITVLDMSNKTGIANVTVEIWNQAGEKQIATATTNADGVAEFSISNKTYVIKLTNVPENYSNVDTYLINKNDSEYTIELLDHSDINMDGSDEEHRLFAYNGDMLTVGANATLYCSSPRTPGYIMTLTGADGLKVVYKDTEYTAENGIIKVKFDDQQYDETNAAPNDFEIINTTDAEISVSMKTATADEGQTKDNPFVLDVGEITTPAFTDTINAYYYEFRAMVKGTVVITSTNARISIYTSESDEPLTDMSVLLNPGESVVVKVENVSGTDAVTFTVDFE